MRRYLHFITKAYSINILQPLIDEIQKSEKGESLIFVSKKYKSLIPSNIKSTSSIKDAILYNPDVVFVPANIVDDRISGLKVQVFHGICEEKGGHYKITGFFDLYCTCGPLITEKFQKLAEKKKHFAVCETGWIKMDKLLADYNREKICEKLKINSQKKIILYAPTFSPRYKSSDTMFPVIEKLPKENEMWILKFHDLMPKEDIKRFEKLSKETFLIYRHHDNSPLLQVADVLISDTSSIVYEFMLLDKPVITINAKVRTEKGINISDIAELRSAIDRSLDNSNEYSENRKNIMKQIHPYYDRNNSQRVLTAVDKALDSDLKSMLKKKPLNLFRKYKLYKKFNII